MFFLRYPHPARVAAILDACTELPCSHDHVGATRTPAENSPAENSPAENSPAENSPAENSPAENSPRGFPRGYTIDRYGTEIGHGRIAFERGCTAIREFAMYPASFTRVQRAQPEIREGSVFATVVRHLGFYSVLPCRIVYTIDAPRQFGFALGTLPGHAECGEERFEIAWDPDTDAVCYRVLAFSRAHAPLARLGYPFTRSLQKRFARDSMASMVRAVACQGASETTREG